MDFPKWRKQVSKMRKLDPSTFKTGTRDMDEMSAVIVVIGNIMGRTAAK
jgi:hypothetical protein